MSGVFDGRETERQAKPPAEGSQRRRLLPDNREAKASPSRHLPDWQKRAQVAIYPIFLKLEGFGRLDRLGRSDRLDKLDRLDRLGKAHRPVGQE